MEKEKVKNKESLDGNISSGGLASKDLMNSSLMQRKSEKRESLIDNSPVQKKAKDKVEAMGINVNYNSSEPAKVGAHAFAQGNTIHLASGQEKHLAHEVGHVIQQSQGRVKATTNINGVAVNDDPKLEKEADVLGKRALQMKAVSFESGSSSKSSGVSQLIGDPDQVNLNDYSKSDSGTKKTAEMKTNGHTYGSAPFQDPAGYSYIRAQGLTNLWIRFHLINEEAGGPGVAWNLVPAAKTDNGQYHSNFEVALKADDLYAYNTNKANGNDDEQVYYGVEVKFLPAVAPANTLTKQATPYFPDKLKVWHKVSHDGGDTWSATHSGTSFTFAGKSGNKVPPDITGVLSVSDKDDKDGIITLLDRAKIVYSKDVYTWLNKNSAYINTLSAYDAESVEANLGVVDATSMVTLEYLANGEKNGEGLINLSRMIALGTITG